MQTLVEVKFGPKYGRFYLPNGGNQDFMRFIASFLSNKGLAPSEAEGNEGPGHLEEVQYYQ